ncbi:hypothetical protein HDV62DRAFT_372669 [Trichoderma sp. SZMC 28011]
MLSSIPSMTTHLSHRDANTNSALKTLQHAINFAQVFAVITMRTLREVATTLARDGYTDQVHTTIAMISNGAEQAEYFRHMLERSHRHSHFPRHSWRNSSETR